MDKENLKQRLIKALNNKSIVNSAFLEMIEQKKDFLNNEDNINDIIKNNKEYLNDYLSKYAKDSTEEEKETIKKLLQDTYTSDKEEVKKQLNKTIEDYKKQNISYINAIENKNYNNYINDLFNTSDLLKYDFFTKYDLSFLYYVHEQITDFKNINNNDDIKEYQKELNYIQDLVKKVNYKKFILISENNNKDVPLTNYIQDELIIREYDDKAIMYRSSLTNLIRKEQNNFLNLNSNIKLKPESIKKNTEIINKYLDNSDLQILDFIISNYYKKGILEFTDTQLANEMFNEKGSQAHVEDRRKINERIIKIQSVRLNLDFELEGNKNAEVWSNNPLIWLKHVGAKIDSEVNRYRILGKPFYLDFNEQAGLIEIEYPRGVLYTRSNNKYKTFRSHNVRIYLVELIKTLPDEDKHYINIDTLYSCMSITAEKYPSYNSFKKERSKGLKIIRDALIDIKKEGINFYYSEDNVGRTIKGFWISKKPILEENKAIVQDSNTENGN